MVVLFQMMDNHFKIPGRVQRWTHQIKDQELLLKDRHHSLGDKWVHQLKTIMINLQHKLKGNLLVHQQEEECQLEEEECQMDKKFLLKMMKMKFNNQLRVIGEYPLEEAEVS